MSIPTFSLIVPTRGRPAPLRTFLDSIAATAEMPAAIEIVLVVDADDPASRVEHERLNVRHVVVPPGLTMGALNDAGYRASTGRYVMLLNDDVQACTPGWDRRIAEVCLDVSDEILLVHVNDGVFGPKLCTFPLVSRTYCELAGGIAPTDYVRYRIDDHVEDVFNLLGVLGERRIVYLPDVRFEHKNHVTNADGLKQYFADPAVLALDAPTFDAHRPARKALALRLKTQIEDRRREARWRARLDGAADAFALRVPGRQRVVADAGLSSENTRVTVAVIAAEGGRACVEAVRKQTRNFDLVVLDRRDDPSFRFGREMNHVLQMARNECVVFLDENVVVGPGWLDVLLGALRGPIGLVMTSPAAALACLLVDRAKCRTLAFDEGYHGHFHALDFALSEKQAGIANATVAIPCGIRGAMVDVADFERDRQRFTARWGFDREMPRRCGLASRVRRCVAQVGVSGLVRIAWHKLAAVS